MANHRSSVDGARVLADLNTLRGIGAYKTGVHKPTFSEAHMRSLQWLAERLPEADLTAEIDGIGLVRTELLFHGRERLPDRCVRLHNRTDFAGIALHNRHPAKPTHSVYHRAASRPRA